MDRISQLPESIIHHILSFININTPAALVRMSVLSKTWFHLTASFPILDFRMCNFRLGDRETFFKYVEYTTSRFSHQDVTAQRFTLSASVWESAELDILNRCIELLIKKGVKKLVIDITNFSASYMPRYRLPNTLLSVSVLKSLILRCCELPSSFMFDVVKFKRLIELRLENVWIDDEVITYLTTSCPLLQVFEIRRCLGFERFCVRHQNVKIISIYNNSTVELIDIEAPNLYRLEVVNNERREPPLMNIACKKITMMTYIGRPIPNANGFTNFLSNFPFIQNLVLGTKLEGNNLKLSSRSLRTLVLHSKYELEGIEFCTPNLGLFIYSSFPWYHGTMVRPLPHLKACMQCYPNDSIDTLWFQKLRLFFDKKNGYKALNLYIHASQNFIVLENLKATELPPYELNHVELHLDAREESSDHAAFVDAVLWCCRPRSLTLRSSFLLSDFEEQSDVVKFTYEKLLQQEDQGRTNIQIVSPFSSKAQKHFKGLMPLLGGSTSEDKAISFIKEELSKEEDSQTYAEMIIF